jgi:hypothetical protein
MARKASPPAASYGLVLALRNLGADDETDRHPKIRPTTKPMTIPLPEFTFVWSFIASPDRPIHSAAGLPS